MVYELMSVDGDEKVCQGVKPVVVMYIDIIVCVCAHGEVYVSEFVKMNGG